MSEATSANLWTVPGEVRSQRLPAKIDGEAYGADDYDLVTRRHLVQCDYSIHKFLLR